MDNHSTHKHRSHSPVRERHISTTNGNTSHRDDDNHHRRSSAAEPLSLEELLQQRKAEEEQKAKPVFLTKDQRAQVALQRRQEEVSAQRARLNALRPPPPPPPSSSSQHHNRDDDRRRDDGRKRDHNNDYDYDRRRMRDSNNDRHHRDHDNRYNNNGKSAEEMEKEKDLELIRQNYLGIGASQQGGRTQQQQKSRRLDKSKAKAKFLFEWDASEDTSTAAAGYGTQGSLYGNRDAALLFGRGYRAGIDRREQKRIGADVEEEILKHQKICSGDGNGGAPSMMPTRRREEGIERVSQKAAAATDRYDGDDMRVDIHWSDKPLSSMTERDWRIFREDFNISYKGILHGALPLRSWEEAGFPDPLMKAVKKAGYIKPSPIQRAAIPLGVKQRDVIGIAETGSGKTAAFVLPMLLYIMKQPALKGNPDLEAEGPYAVVLAPTRELAQQIEIEAKKLCEYTDYRVISIVGGQSIEEQGFALRRGCEIVVATPGRLNDCIDRSYAVLNQCNYVVLDEADRMIDMGFEPQVVKVLDAMPSSNLKPENAAEEEANRVYRTTYMFSATMASAVERLARKYLRRPVVVTIGTAGKAAANVTQRVLWVKENEKNRALSQEMEHTDPDARIIVFVNTKRACETVTNHLLAKDYAVTMLHGGKTQEQREESINGFRKDKYNILVATDVAGRGIDVPNVALVINYDMPNTVDAYTHRIGRTGRAGKKGTAVTLLTVGDVEVFYDLKKYLVESKAPVPKELANHEAARQPKGMGGH
jgi:ATP-dependent RNA helicase DDX23/PRP28